MRRAASLWGVVVLGLLLVFTSGVAGADLIDLGDTTLDSQTGLEWLDVPITADCSWEAASASAGTCGGIQLSEWTLAPISDLYEFWENAGISIQNTITWSSVNTVPIQSLLTLVGITRQHSSTFYGTTGWVADAPRHWAQIFFQEPLSRDYYSTSALSGAQPSVGAWLYRAHVAPEPSTALLWGLDWWGWGCDEGERGGDARTEEPKTPSEYWDFQLVTGAVSIAVRKNVP